MNLIAKKIQNDDVLPQQIAATLRQAIESGTFKRGDRLPGDRVLAQENNWGRSSVIAAVKILEKEGLLYRLPGKGTFIAPDVEQRMKMVKVALCREMPRVSEADSVGITMETYLGAIEEAERDGALLSILHFSSSDDALVVQRQFEQLQQFDGVMFIGSQLEILQKKVIENRIPSVRIPANFMQAQAEIPLIAGDTDHAIRTIGEYIVSRNYSRVKILTDCKGDGGIDDTVAFSNYKSNMLRLYLLDHMPSIEVESLRVSRGNEHSFDRKAMAEFLEQSVTTDFCEKTDLLVVFYTHLLPFLYQRLYELNLQPGVDVDMVALCGEITTMNLCPALSYYRIGYRDIGTVSIRRLIELIRGKDVAPVNRIIGNLVIQASSRK